MIKIKCPICDSDSYCKSASIDIMRLAEGTAVALQCGHEVRAIRRPVEKDPDSPYIEIEVFGVEKDRE
jgi:hypothetical protein